MAENTARGIVDLERWWFAVSTTVETLGTSLLTRYEYKVIDTGKHVEEELNELGADGWHVVGVTTKKQMLIAPPQAIILMREVQTNS
jgi:hypothetical protein